MRSENVHVCDLECSQAIGDLEFLQAVDPHTSTLKEDGPRILVSRDRPQEAMTVGVRLGGVDVTRVGAQGQR